MDIKILSNSKWGCYESCPKKFQFQFDWRIKVPMSPILLKGIRVHDVFYNFFKKIRDEKIIIKNPEVQFPKIIEWKKEFNTEINNFLDRETQRWHNLKNKDLFVPFIMEKRVTNKIHGFGGTPDRIDLCDDGEYELVDYKTGQVRSFPSHYKTQLSGYIYLAEEGKLVPKPIKRASIFWVSHGEYKTAERSKFYGRYEFIMLVREMLEKIRADNKPKAVSSPLCVFCDYHQYCPNSKWALKKWGYLAEKHGIPIRPQIPLPEKYEKSEDFYEEPIMYVE